MTPSAPAGADPLLEFRSEFPILEKTVYMVSHSLGAMPRGVETSMAEFARSWGERGVRAWQEGWWELPVDLGDVLAPVIGAPPGSMAMLQNVTVAEAVVLSALDFPAERDGLVCTELDFPSCLYLYEGERARGADVRMAKSPDGISMPVERILELIDERTRLVAISHVLFRSAFVVDVEPVIRRAHEVGALVMLDSYQAVGTLPIDVQALDVDVLVGGSVKWLCGGPGAGYLYVHPRLRSTLKPRFTGWSAHARPFAFETRMDYASTVDRFLNGTAHVPCLYAARPGYELVKRAVVERIRAKSLRLTRRILDWAAELKIPVRTPLEDARRGGTVSLALPDAERVAGELIRRDIIVDWRPEAGVRVAPHYYSTEDEVDHLMRNVSELMEKA